MPSGDQKLREARIIVAATVLVVLVPDLNVVTATAQFVKSVENVTRQYLICRGDPFDPNFRTVLAPSFHALPQVQANQCIPSDLVPIVNAQLDHSGRVASYLLAVYTTDNRAQSAFTFGDAPSFSLQDQTIGSYADSLVAEYSAAQMGEQTLAQRLTGSPCDVSVTQSDVQAFLDAVRTQGVDALPQIERDLIAAWGIDPAPIINLLLSVDPGQVPTRVVDILNMAAQLDGEFANLYR
jgi:hypothetical protein